MAGERRSALSEGSRKRFRVDEQKPIGATAALSAPPLGSRFGVAPPGKRPATESK
jgi:hypothetical protein